MATPRVLIADDHPLILEGLTSLLGRSGFDVIGGVEVAGEVVASYEAVRPDVLVLDIRFGSGPNGLDVARQLLLIDTTVRIVFFSQFDQDEIVRETYRMGGMAFIPKNSPPGVLADAIRHAHRGQVFFLPAIAERLALWGVHGDPSPQAKLDPREIEVFKQMAEGRTNHEIAERMKLSLKTISTTSQTIKDKLGVKRAAEITRLAFKHGLIQP